MTRIAGTTAPESSRMSRNAMREILATEFARRLRAASSRRDERFGFFLGAGCSASSGIPTAGRLVADYWLPRLRDLRAPDRTDLDAWATEVFPGFDPLHPAGFYGPVLQELFLDVAEERQREIEFLCDGRLPQYGYATLAQLMAADRGTFSVGLTTNFDDLLSDAFFLFTEVRPLVITHESLAGYIRATRVRPLVIKLHGDYHLSPQNTSAETDAVKRETEAHVQSVLQDRGLVFIGYGGRERGILHMLATLPASALPCGVYWASVKQPPKQMTEWLESRGATQVLVGDFDELMVLIRDEFGLPHPQKHRFDIIFDKYRERYTHISQRIANRPATTAESVELKAAAERVDNSLPSEWAPLREAHRTMYIDPAKAEQICRDALDRFANSSPLLVLNAVLLSRRDPNAAEADFRRAISANPRDDHALATYALFLKNVRHDLRAAEEHYRRALRIDRTSAAASTNYTFFLIHVRRRPDEAARIAKRCLAERPEDPTAIADYASALWGQGKLDDAENRFRSALHGVEDASAMVAYALFLQIARCDLSAARQLYARAVELEPASLDTLANYGSFLLAEGDTTDGLALLDKLLASEESSFPHAPPIVVDAHYCIYANGPLRRRRDALHALKQLLEAGHRSHASTLDPTITRAEKQGHTEAAWLRPLRDVVNDRTPLDALYDWNEWRRA